MREFYASDDINAKAVNDFFFDSLKKDNHIHAISIYKNGEKKLEFAPFPYSLFHKREIYSLSKSFTSAAIGAAWDEGLINLDERLIDIFPDKLPNKISPNLEQMTVRHCLIMNTGHESCVMKKMYDSPDPAKAFLSCEVKYTPGTHFLYNTGASCMLAAILEKKTGRKLYDYASQKILEPLGITKSRWTECAGNVNEGGIGLHISCADITKFGLMLANRGISGNKRILSQEWIEAAGAVQTDNTINGDSGTGNWTSGYGFQFWRTARDGYRGDGLKGQLCMIMPKNNAVVSIVACTRNMEEEIADTVTLVENLIGKSNEEINIPDYPPLFMKDKTLPEYIGKTIIADKNPLKITSLHIDKTDSGIAATIYNGSTRQVLYAGNGIWEESYLRMPAAVPKILDFMDPYQIEDIHTAASFTIENNALVLKIKHLSDPHTVYIKVTQNKNRICAHFETEWMPEMLPDDAKIIGATIK